MSVIWIPNVIILTLKFLYFQEDESQRVIEDVPSNHTAATEVKREHHPKATPQPTSEQLMIAQLIGGDSKLDDPNQRQKIQQVKFKINSVFILYGLILRVTKLSAY